MKLHEVNNNKNSGMALLELLILVTIVASIFSVALPTWNSEVQKPRRADARNTLRLVQVEQAKYRADNGSYVSSMSALGLSADDSTSRDFYTVSIVSSSATAFVAGAAPNTNSGQKGDSCGSFAINQSSPYGSGSYASLTDCW